MTSGRAERSVTVGKAPPRRPVPTAGHPGRREVVEALRDEIREHGRITFARFMERALYEPGLGYYATSPDRPGRAGDFLTAPELHPLFGRAVARQVQEVWQLLGQPHPFVLREYGAGSGTLGLAILQELAAIEPAMLEATRYQPIEIAGRIDVIRNRASAAGFGDMVDQAVAGEPVVACVLANEFLDALPVHRVTWRDGRLHELYVGWHDGQFVEVEGEPSSAALIEWFADAGVALGEGQRAEVNLALVDWVQAMAAELRAGCALIFDYGAEPAALYGADRNSGTLRAFRGHHVSSDLFAAVGEVDLTAHVDLEALRRAARRAGLEEAGTVTQAEFLMGCGLEELVAAEQAALPDEWQPRLLLRSTVGRLLDPRAMGGYRVVVLGRGMPARGVLRGLSFRLPERG